jgi:hypothetical protein
MNPASSLETKRKNKSLFFIFFKKGMNAPESISYMAAVVAGGCHFDPFILHQHSFLSTHIYYKNDQRSGPTTATRIQMANENSQMIWQEKIKQADDVQIAVNIPPKIIVQQLLNVYLCIICLFYFPVRV